MEAPDYLSEPLARFLDDAAARQPVPGGGSVSALAAALGVTLGEMSANYSRERDDKPEPPAVQACLTKLGRAGACLRQLVAEDMAAYAAYAAARKSPAADRIAAAAVATLVPLEIAAVAAAAVAVMADLVPVCNRHLLSDLRAGAMLAEAAARAVAENVRVNLPDLPEKDAAEAETKLDSILEHAADALARTLNHP
jgi:formiminotetrahydrofolate cyclodeaminase